jgi:hypothetical protein
VEPERVDLEPDVAIGDLRPLADQARLLAFPAFRTFPWPPFVVVVVLGALALLAAAGAEAPPPDGGLPIVGALIAVWFASLLGDRSAPIADGTPPHRFFRRVVRLGVGSPIVVALWIAALANADEGPHAETLTFLFVAEVCIALAAGAIALHTVEPGREVLWAAGGLFMVFIALPFGLGLELTPIPTEDTWWMREGRWLAIGGGATLAFLLASLDPARRHLLRIGAPPGEPAPATRPRR